jgi:hypothetical protein
VIVRFGNLACAVVARPLARNPIAATEQSNLETNFIIISLVFLDGHYGHSTNYDDSMTARYRVSRIQNYALSQRIKNSINQSKKWSAI